MTSSGFSKPKNSAKRPAVCHPSPPPGVLRGSIQFALLTATHSGHTWTLHYQYECFAPAAEAYTVTMHCNGNPISNFNDVGTTDVTKTHDVKFKDNDGFISIDWNGNLSDGTVAALHTSFDSTF